jgi:predicted transcriptional regulator
MVYDELRPVTYRQDVHLKDGKDRLTLVYTTVPGISILGTSRLLHSEAACILTPHLKRIAMTQPTITIKADYLRGLMDFKDSFAMPRTFWDWFLRHIKHNSSCLKYI